MDAARRDSNIDGLPIHGVFMKQWATRNVYWAMGNGLCTIRDGQWAMGDGQWAMGDGH